MMSDASDDIWGDDSFGRNEDAAFLKRFLIERIKERKAIGLH